MNRVHRTQGLIVATLMGVATSACSGQEPLAFCSETEPCPAGQVCHLPTHSCMAAGRDRGAPDLSPDRGPDMVIKDSWTDVGADLSQDLSDTRPPDAALPAGYTCSTDAQCLSGFCTDGYCCDKKCGGECQSCAQAGKRGICSPYVSGTDPENDCTGSKECGRDVCDGQGKCTAAMPASTVCFANCKTGDLYTLQQNFCDGLNGSCLATAKDTSCKPFRCLVVAGKAACATGCVTHSECTGGLCDRTAAHETGLGACVGAGDIIKVGPKETYTTVKAGVAAALAGKKKVVLVAAGLAQELITISSGELTLVGQAASGAVHMLDIRISGQARVSLQGLHLTKLSVLKCKGLSVTKRATLVVVESQIKNSIGGPGVESMYCDVVLRRNRIQFNPGGGADLSDGQLTIVNNVVANNGKKDPGGSGLGGFHLNTASPVIFTNNTVADNVASKSNKKAAGIICGKETVYNSIVWGNDGHGQSSSCTFVKTDVQGGLTNVNPVFYKDYRPQAAACVDSGQGGAPGLGLLDITNGPRKKGKGTDMGAYEIK